MSIATRSRFRAAALTDGKAGSSTVRIAPCQKPASPAGMYRFRYCRRKLSTLGHSRSAVSLTAAIHPWITARPDPAFRSAIAM